MRSAPAERQQAEQVLKSEGWAVVKIPKDFMRAERYHSPAIMMKWCEDTVGPGRVEPGSNWLDDNDVWYMYTWYGHWSFHFKHEKDATAFTLRWT